MRWLLSLVILAPAVGQAQSSAAPVLGYAGLQGLLMPTYDRVDGLSLPIGAVITAPGDVVIAEPRLTYRSRLGAWDPRVDVSVAPMGQVGVDLRAARETRTNEGWIYDDLVNSATSLFIGSDVRNYYRAAGGDARLVFRDSSETLVFSAFAGAGTEDDSPITAAGNVFAFHGKKSDEKILRPNPLVQSGRISSAIFGGAFRDSTGVVASRGTAMLEKSFDIMSGAGSFTQVTLDAHVKFPTFADQVLSFRGHAVATSSSNTPRARYAYLGGSGTLPVLELLQVGGDELVFVETRYLLPVDRLTLPVVGHPVLTARHIMGSAGVGGLPDLEQEIGVGLGLSAVRFDFTTDVAHHRASKVGLGISFGH